ncbi:MAG: VWA domain-containing protein [Myxococcales bacterium]|nr:VWA domain-containing protein [Myxococcales bacterium]MCB9532726.1 VWA domain-containing protein [Myxococcales bacterium]
MNRGPMNQGAANRGQMDWGQMDWGSGNFGSVGVAALHVFLAAGLLGGCAGEVSFEYPWVLVCGAVALVVAAGAALRRPGATMAYTRVQLVRGVRPSLRAVASRLPNLARALAAAALVVATARPQVDDFESRTVEGIDMFLVLDMSGSMAAVDLHPNAISRYQAQYGAEPPNRFDNAIATLHRFVAARTRDRIGMVVFARDAFLQFPLTLDTSTIQTLLQRLQLNAIDSSATAIGNALGLSIRGLLNSDAKSRAIILITDGKQQGGNISPAEAAETAASLGLRIYTILVGREGPTMVPTQLVGRDGLRRYAQQEYPVDAELLRQLAETTGGSFYRAEEPEELERDLNSILDELDRSAMTDVASTQKRELFAPFAAAALALLTLEGLLRWLFARRYP